MDLGQILQFLGTHLLVASVAALLLARRERAAVLAAIVGLVGVVVVTVLMASARPGASFIPYTLHDMMTPRPFVAVMLGGATGLAWLLLLVRPAAHGGRRLVRPLGMALSLAAVALAGVAYARAEKSGPTGGVARDARFVVERIAETEADPIAVTVDEQDRVYISLQLLGQELYDGQVARVDDGAGTKPGRLVVVADSPALFRPFGIAARGGKLYVSRSGFMAHATAGRIEYENGGAVTRLSDLDGDGLMDYYEDVVRGLPGCQGSAATHQNNEILFGPQGELYITSGACSDRDVFNHPWEGTILVASPDFETVEVYARGLRNPFGLCYGPDGKMFCTDNDTTVDNPGDELNLVEKGADYGHPYVIAADDGGGAFRKPIVNSPSDGNFTGMTYSNAPELPADCRDCLYVTDFIGNRILRVHLTPNGDTYDARIEVIASVPLPIDIAVTSKGVFYITSRVGAVFRIRLR